MSSGNTSSRAAVFVNIYQADMVKALEDTGTTLPSVGRHLPTLRNMHACGRCAGMRKKCNMSAPYSIKKCEGCTIFGALDCPPHIPRRNRRKPYARPNRAKPVSTESNSLDCGTPIENDKDGISSRELSNVHDKDIATSSDGCPSAAGPCAVPDVTVFEGNPFGWSPIELWMPAASPFPSQDSGSAQNPPMGFPLDQSFTLPSADADLLSGAHYTFDTEWNIIWEQQYFANVLLPLAE
ncbi:hypothetical protein M0805_003672 [Coniferiporia weirii]|nr:hypothetical protein M0805_003672 [Coniferiporia weirii]